MEADLHRYYHLDLVDLWRGRLTRRKLCALIAHLPPESAVCAWERGAPHWSTTHDLLEGIRLAYASVHTPRDKPLPKPHPASPAGRMAEERRQQTEAEWEASRQREEARQARLAARRQEQEQP